MARPPKKVPIVIDELREWTKPVGKIVAPHGLKGEVRIRPLNELTDKLFVVGATLCLVSPSGRRQWVTIQNCRRKGTILIVKFAELATIEEAERCVGFDLMTHKDWRPPLNEGEFLLSDLLGLTVVTKGGEIIGEVTDVMESAAHDLLVTDRGLIPMVKEIIKGVDLKGRRIIIDPPKGLLEGVPRKRLKRRWQK